MLSRLPVAAPTVRLWRSGAGRYLLLALGFFVLATSVPPGNPFFFSAVSLLPPHGLRFEGPSLVTSQPTVEELNATAFREGRFSVDIELSPARDDLQGPARIVALSQDPTLQNWILGQRGSDLVVRHRGRETVFPHALRLRRRQRLVLVFLGQEVALFAPGAPPSRARLYGRTAPWRDSCRFGLGNEVSGDRPWEGKLLSLALFDRPLTQTEVEGLLAATPGPSAAEELRPYLRLRTGSQRKVELVAGSGTAMGLQIYRWTWSLKVARYRDAWRQRSSQGSLPDLAGNLLLTLPVGLFLTSFLRQAGKGSLYCLLTVIATQAALSLAVETLQLFSPHRFCDPRDVVVNVFGAAVGWGLDQGGLGQWLRRRARR